MKWNRRHQTVKPINRIPAASDTVQGKFGVTLFGVVFLGFGLVFSWFIVNEIHQTLQTRNWIKTPCTITQSYVDTVSDGYAFYVKYRYKWKNTVYHSSQFQMGSTSFIKKKVNQADALASEFQKGRKTFCHVNPHQPSVAILKHKSLVVGFFILIPLLFIIIGIGIIYGTWRSSKKRHKTVSLSEKASSKKLGKIAQTGFFLIFFFAGLGFGYAMIFPAAIKSLNADEWIETPCIVQSSRVQSHDSDDGTTYSVDIVYEYTFRDRTYRSGQYKFMGGSSSGYQGKAAIVKQHPKGKKTICYVNPENPSDAVLTKQLGAEAFLALIPLVFMAVGLWGTFYTLRGKKLSGFRNLSGKTLSQRTNAAGQRVLKPKTSSKAKIFGNFAIAVFWNGVVSVFLFQAVSGWQSGNPDYSLTLFLIPFALIGIFLIFSFFYYVMAAFNPRPVLFLLKDTMRLGDHIDIKWSTSGNVYKIVRFKLILIGEETATYRRGTTIFTDQYTFYSQVLIDSDNPESMRRGELTFFIPSESMHSFKSDNNAIVWKINMRCDIPRWPDVNDDFVINVIPMLIEEF